MEEEPVSVDDTLCELSSHWRHLKLTIIPSTCALALFRRLHSALLHQLPLMQRTVTTSLQMCSGIPLSRSLPSCVFVLCVGLLLLCIHLPFARHAYISASSRTFSLSLSGRLCAGVSLLCSILVKILSVMDTLLHLPSLIIMTHTIHTISLALGFREDFATLSSSLGRWQRS
jgi:hypothetical protein